MGIFDFLRNNKINQKAENGSSLRDHGYEIQGGTLVLVDQGKTHDADLINSLNRLAIDLSTLTAEDLKKICEERKDRIRLVKEENGQK